MSRMSPLAFGVTELGPVRKNNEDCLLIDDGLQLFVVRGRDGRVRPLGGGSASRLAVDTLASFNPRFGRRATSFSWPYGIAPSPVARRKPPADRDSTSRTAACFAAAEASDDYGRHGHDGRERPAERHPHHRRARRRQPLVPLRPTGQVEAADPRRTRGWRPYCRTSRAKVPTGNPPAQRAHQRARRARAKPRST